MSRLLRPASLVPDDVPDLATDSGGPEAAPTDAPEVVEDTVLEFALTASDPANSSHCLQEYLKVFQVLARRADIP